MCVYGCVCVRVVNNGQDQLKEMGQEIRGLANCFVRRLIFDRLMLDYFRDANLMIMKSDIKLSLLPPFYFKDTSMHAE